MQLTNLLGRLKLSSARANKLVSCMSYCQLTCQSVCLSVCAKYLENYISDSLQRFVFNREPTGKCIARRVVYSDVIDDVT